MNPFDFSSGGAPKPVETTMKQELPLAYDPTGMGDYIQRMTAPNLQGTTRYYPGAEPGRNINIPVDKSMPVLENKGTAGGLPSNAPQDRVFRDIMDAMRPRPTDPSTRYPGGGASWNQSTPESMDAQVQAMREATANRIMQEPGTKPNTYINNPGIGGALLPFNSGLKDQWNTLPMNPTPIVPYVPEYTGAGSLNPVAIPPIEEKKKQPSGQEQMQDLLKMSGGGISGLGDYGGGYKTADNIWGYGGGGNYGGNPWG